MSELLRWGFAVPQGFVVRAEALEGVTANAPWSAGLAQELETVLLQLGPGPLAVRSSGVAEDSAASSFAGVHETVLGVEGLEALVAAVKRCALSGDTERARSYRENRGLPQSGLAVIIQQQLAPRVSGVAFSCEPVKRSPELVVVEAVPGLGEALVSGAVTPSRAMLDRNLALRSLEGPDGAAASIDRELAKRVAKVTLEVEAKHGGPVDLEWAEADGKLWLLQCRPVTTQVSDRRTVWSNTNAAEILPNVVKPLVYGTISRYVASMLSPVLSPFGLTTDSLGVIGLVKGRVYFNVNALLGWARSMPWARKQNISKLAKGLGGDEERFAAALALLRPEDLPTHRIGLGRLVIGSLAVAWGLLRHMRSDGTGAVRALREVNERFATVEPCALSDKALADFLQAATHEGFGPKVADTLFTGAWGFMAVATLPELTRRWLGDEHGVLGRRLLQGMGGLASASSGLALGELSEHARNVGLVPFPTGDWPAVRAKLEHTSAGRSFLERFEHFLKEHGHHGPVESDLSVPRWRERPEPLLEQLRSLTMSSVSIAEEERGRRAAREELLASLGARLGFFRRWLLFAFAERARCGLAARENARSEAMKRVSHIRRAALEASRRLVARGALLSIEDIWFLEWDELDLALRGASPALTERVSERRVRHMRYEAARPEDVIVEGATLPSTERAAVGPTLPGIAASPGVVEGRARVVLKAEDCASVLPGEVLVAPFTDPGWVPSFLNAVAVVTDFGGLLSHGAVVAREYGLPAVVNTRSATARIHTGQRIRVDGDRGVVELL